MNLETRKSDQSLFDSFFAAFILMGGMATAMAEPAGHGPDAAEKAARLEQRQERLNLRQAENKMLEERRRATLANLLDSKNDPSKRVNRLTPDERRDLRRQINQAGQDIYVNTPNTTNPPKD